MRNALANEHWDAVLSDFRLPRFNGVMESTFNYAVPPRSDVPVLRADSWPNSPSPSEAARAGFFSSPLKRVRNPISNSYPVSIPAARVARSPTLSAPVCPPLTIFLSMTASPG